MAFAPSAVAIFSQSSTLNLPVLILLFKSWGDQLSQRKGGEAQPTTLLNLVAAILNLVTAILLLIEKLTE